MVSVRDAFSHHPVAMQALLLLLDALDLPAVLRAAAGEGATWQPSSQSAASVQAELEAWLMEPSLVQGPLLLAWAAAAIHAFPEAQQRTACDLGLALAAGGLRGCCWQHE